MGKSYEALERAEKEYQETYLGVSSKPRKSRRAATTHQKPQFQAAMARCESLKSGILTRYPDVSLKIILFTGTAQGSGASTIAAAFSAAMAKDGNLKVLLVDINLKFPSLHDVFQIDKTPGFCDILTKGGSVSSVINKVGPGKLYLLPCGGMHSGAAGIFESNRFDQFLKKVRNLFDYVILDAPSFPAFPESSVLCSKTDGVIMVLESNKTRRQVSIRAKKDLEEAGANILGVVLNRRRHYIPQWIYLRL